jgi:branched-chain amino acid transport system permease protein
MSTYFWQVTLNALLLGGVYALMAQGLALIFSVLKVVNLAHGEFIMVGAFLAWFGFQTFGIGPYLAVPVIALLGAGIGWLVSRSVVIPLLKHHFLMTLLATFGLSIVLQSIVNLIFGPGARSVNVPYVGAGLDVFGLRIPLVTTVNAAVAVGVLALLWMFLHYTRPGKAMRAASENHEASRLVGIDLKKIYGLAFAIGIGLTMVSGTLLSPVEPIFPFMGPPLTLKVFAIVVLGGLGSMRGLVLAACLVALAESYIAAYVPGIGTGLGAAVAFILLVVVLALRPGGVAGARAVAPA